MRRGTSIGRRRALFRDSRGLSTVEYVIILALIAVVGFVVWTMIGRHAAERNRGAGVVVDGLATHSSTDEEGGHAGGGGHGATGGSGSTPMVGHGATAGGEEAAAAAGASSTDLWRWGILAGVVFGGMILWLARQKAG